MHKKGEDKVVIIHVNEMTRSIGKLVVLLTWEKLQELTIMTFMINTVLVSLVKNLGITLEPTTVQYFMLHTFLATSYQAILAIGLNINHN